MKTPETGRQALIIVDYQNDFAKPGAPLYVQGGEQLVSYINDLMREVKTRSGIVIATRDWHPEKSVHFDAWPRHCVAGIIGAEYAEGFDASLVDTEIFKGYKNSDDGYSGFEWVTKLLGNPQDGFEVAPDAETLKEVLFRYNIRIVNIVGLATDFCVKATALDAAQDFETIVHNRGIQAVNIKPEDGKKAFTEMQAQWVKIVW